MDFGEMLILLSLVIPRENVRALRIGLNSLLEDYCGHTPKEVLSALSGAASKLTSADT